MEERDDIGDLDNIAERDSRVTIVDIICGP
jgi:hypothetical protein